LGYRGYPHLQEAIRRRLPHYPTFVERLEKDDVESESRSVLSRSFGKDRQNLARAAESIDPHAFERLVDALLGARQTVLAGGGVARPVVLYLFSSLRMMGYDVRDTTAGSTTLAQEVAALEPADLFLAIGYYRYLRETVEALEAARALGVSTAVITDSPVSPLVALADVALCVPVDSASHRISLVASMAVANALLAALTARDHDRVAAALRRVNEQYQRANLVIYD
ncbi:MAG: MurR/RpiR family transcriptional regulator, partial [Actinomycetota bacterium]|nr:MurR/RpiR family transcriptional regulator [Actinomycetota bacterium]